MKDSSDIRSEIASHIQEKEKVHDKLPACDDYIKNSTETFYFDQPQEDQDQDDTQMIGTTDDKMSTGAVPMSTYVTYLRAIKNPALITAALSFYFLASGAQFYQQFIVAKWTEAGSGAGMSAALGDNYLLSLLKAAGVVSISLWLRSFMLMLAGTR